jgi:DEAD/DEAH box helicase domain-containing protein
MNLAELLTYAKWEIVHTEHLPAQPARFVAFEDLPLGAAAQAFLTQKFPAGIYEHQKLAIKLALQSKNVCLTTGTASGKSLAFFVAGLEALARSPGAKVIALYPMRALGKEQEDRWAAALQEAGLDAAVGRIDGRVPMPARLEILQRSRVLILTPDVMHAWMLTQLGAQPVRDFLRQLELIVVDEVHSYTGIFGSNSAFLFRRLRHILQLLAAAPQFVCASATLADSQSHLAKLFGVDFEIIDSSHDSSPRQPIRIDLIRPPAGRDLLNEFSALLAALAEEKSQRFIAFVDNRKQTELIASIAGREKKGDRSEAAAPEQEEPALKWDHLKRAHILPYRAGYEEQDRATIQERLSGGSLAGVVSTSALELGLDIPYLTAGILFGVPYSTTSFYQRIGRIGRHAPGHVVIVSRGTVYDQQLFANPTALLSRPLAEDALYLENERLQYIHALCLARRGGEHDQVAAAENLAGPENFVSAIAWPEGFLALCEKERHGGIPAALQVMKGEAGDDPNHVFPLRDVEMQFKVQERLMGRGRNLGEISHAQLMREAYPGAIYYYTTKPYRVIRVNTRRHEVHLRHHQKKYTTSPAQLPALIFPDLAPGRIYQAKSYGALTCVECHLQVREALSGYAEQRGPYRINVAYPADAEATGVHFEQSRFSRNYLTTGVILAHPALGESWFEAELIAAALFEAFLMIVPYERRDAGFAADKFRLAHAQLNAQNGARFIAIYDQTYGSLRLTSRLLSDSILRAVISAAIELCGLGEATEAKEKTIAALEQLLAEAAHAPINHATQPAEEKRPGKNLIPILLPGSKGLALHNGNTEFEVEEIFFDAISRRLSYRGRYVDEQYANATTKIILPVEGLIEVPGDSMLSYYDLESGGLVLQR